MSDLRRSLDALLEAKPGVMISQLDMQPETRTMTEGAWVLLEFEDGESFAIFKHTGCVYRRNEYGAVGDEPMLDPNGVFPT